MEAENLTETENLTPEEALLAADLDDWLGDEDFIPTLEAKGSPEVAGAELTRLSQQEHADTLLWRIKRAQRELHRIGQLASARRQRIDKWEKDRSAGPKYVIAEAERQLEAIARSTLGPKETGFSVPNGRVTLRKPSERLVVVDEAAALEYLKKRVDAGDMPVEVIRTKEEPAVAVLKAQLVAPSYGEPAEGVKTAPAIVDPEAGEAVPGVQWQTDAERGFTYKPADG